MTGTTRVEFIKSFRNIGTSSLLIDFYRDKDMKEIDLIIVNDDKLYPIEIKKMRNPQKSLVKSFNVLRKVLAFTVENEMILCYIENNIKIDISTIAYPIALV